MGWKVFLPDRFIAPVKMKIHEIAGSVGGSVPGEVGLMGGKAGLACFYAYYADWIGDGAFGGTAAELIEQALNPAAGHFPGYTFSGGMSGIAWLIHHLSAMKMQEWDASSVFDELDIHLYNRMMEDVNAGHYDYLHGALGNAIYFLRHAQQHEYRVYLAQLIDALEEISVEDETNCLSWRSVLDAEKHHEGVNLGLSHGMASIIIMLSKMHSAGVAESKCERLLRGGLCFLDKQMLDPGQHLSVFPAWSKESMETVSASRLAWCYGDPGIGLAYLAADAIMPQNDYKARAVDILLRTTLRRDLDENYVFDAGICHGAAGLALFYNILFQRTDLVPFREASLYWLDVCLNMAQHEDGIAGYKSWYSPAYGGWKNIPGLLEGVAGIGLVLLAFISGRPPAWSEALLLY
jgi:lantibiotic modifying enzyme